MSPPSALRLAIAPAPRRQRRDAGVRPLRVSPVPPEGWVVPPSPLPTLAPLSCPPSLRTEAPSPGPSGRIQSS